MIHDVHGTTSGAQTGDNYHKPPQQAYNDLPFFPGPAMRYPLHPTLVHFPVACWSLAVAADYISLWSGTPTWRFTDGLIAVGCVMALLAMLAGLLEIISIPEDGDAMRDAIIHAGFMIAALLLFGIRFMQGPYGLAPVAPNMLSFILDAAGFLVLFIGGWYGGRLVYQHGIGGRVPASAPAQQPALQQTD